ncbi:MAG: glycosyltransferase family 4 protein [Romboutsia timonensis]|uniref:glycosyltransferase family 4 protein n=1 Tax=Romboutsia timonensis TaxID=1776391 RepID=UPI002A759697|nr:glycosyltransferase family 4 protein [Romboutsia timonensis]MDY2884041.1 glycosyltransferase family 4 protein [Romboutsia timonensis]
MKKSICFVAQFPPPIHGLSKAVDTLYNSNINKSYDLRYIDITNNKKFLSTVNKLIHDKSELYYFTISQTILGNLRDLILLKIMSMKKKNIIIHLHGGYYRTMLDECKNIQKGWNLKLLKEVSASIVLGDSLKYIFKDIISDEKIYVVPNCIDDEFYISNKEFEDKIKDMKIKKRLQILYLSNFIEEKGYKEVLEIAKILKKSDISKFEFVFAGKFFDSKDKKYFNEFIENNNLSDIVKYKGIVKGHEKRELLKKSDIFFLLTRYKNEGQPISIIEGMGNGLCIFTTNHAGIPDLVNNNDNGFIVDYHDYDAILNKLDELYEKRNLLINIAKKNRDDVNLHFKEVNYINNMKNIFNEVANEKG